MIFLLIELVNNISHNNKLFINSIVNLFMIFLLIELVNNISNNNKRLISLIVNSLIY